MSTERPFCPAKTPVLLIVFTVVAAALMASRASAQVKAVTPSTQPDLKNDRLAFLTIQLSSIEESLKALDSAIKRTGYKVQLNQEKVKQYEKGNELMDRKGGGPMPWDQFYGRTADKFFYHPTDPNTKYRFGNNNADGKAPVPAPQRPPQLDYFYQANMDQARQAAAEVAALGNDVNRLLQRRRQLELEQSAMWATIATEAVQDLNIAQLPLYRFQLRSTATGAVDAQTAQRLAVVRAFVIFIRQVDRNAQILHDSVPRDQSGGYRICQKNVLALYQQLQRDLFAQPMSSEPSDGGKRIGSLLSQAKRLKDFSTNAGDAFHIQTAADDAGDELRHRTARGQLQEAVLGSAEVLQLLHLDLMKMAGDWGIEGEPGKESQDVLPVPALTPEVRSVIPSEVNSVTTPQGTTSDAERSRPAPVPSVTESPPLNKPINLLAQLALREGEDVVTGKWELSKDGLLCSNGGKLRLPYTPGQEYDFHIEFTRLEGQGDVVQQLSQGDRRFAWLMGYWKNSAFGFGRIGGKSADQNRTTVHVSPALNNGKRYSCVVQVRQKSIAASIDRKRIAHYETDFSDMSEQPAWAIDGALGIGCNSSTVFHVLEITPVSGEGQIRKHKAAAPRP